MLTVGLFTKLVAQGLREEHTGTVAVALSLGNGDAHHN